MLSVTRETKAILTPSAGGRVIAWHNDREAKVVSIAIPGDRAKLTPLEARRLAAWLIEAATTTEKAPGRFLASEAVARW